MDAHQIEALALVVLDGVSILVPAARVPIEILHKILDGLDESDAIPFSFAGLSEEKVAQVRATLAGMAAARASAVTSEMAKKNASGHQAPAALTATATSGASDAAPKPSSKP